jgi:hypothetical protein
MSQDRNNRALVCPANRVLRTQPHEGPGLRDRVWVDHGSVMIGRPSEIITTRSCPRCLRDGSVGTGPLWGTHIVAMAGCLSSLAIGCLVAAVLSVTPDLSLAQQPPTDPGQSSAPNSEQAPSTGSGRAPSNSPSTGTGQGSRATSANSGQDQRRLYIQEYRVEGTHKLTELEVEEAVYPYLGPSRTTEDVEHARATLEKAYQDKGY